MYTERGTLKLDGYSLYLENVSTSPFLPCDFWTEGRGRGYVFSRNAAVPRPDELLRVGCTPYLHHHAYLRG